MLHPFIFYYWFAQSVSQCTEQIEVEVAQAVQLY